jgi:hypothetical protein
MALRGTCIIILDKKYNRANNSRFGPYKKNLVTDRSIYCHMTLSAMNYLLYMNHVSVSNQYMKSLWFDMSTTASLSLNN